MYACNITDARFSFLGAVISHLANIEIYLSLVEEKRYTVAGIPKGIRKIYSTDTKRAPTRLQRPSTVVSHPDKKLRGEGIIVT